VALCEFSGGANVNHDGCWCETHNRCGVFLIPPRVSDVLPFVLFDGDAQFG
jgi:hypothetical protein